VKTRRIGSLHVTEVGVGCNNLGWMIDEAASLAVVDAALNAGINTFDTADVYGDGQSEILLGRALRGRATAR
jgi:aryl-alcohol dehydrogenase-like predicted oxidoreductase